MLTVQRQFEWLKRVQWIILAGAMLALAGFYIVGYRPLSRRLASLNQHIAANRRELEQNLYKARNLPTLAFEVQQLESQVQNYDKQMPKQPDLGQFIKDITQISQQLALQEWKYEPGVPKRADAFFELPIRMHFKGDFVSVASFLRQVEDMGRLTRVQRLIVNSREARNGAVEVEMAMTIYFSEG